MRTILISVGVFAVAAWAQTAEEWPTGKRTTPPTIRAVSPLGVARGATAEMTVEGFNLAGASQIFFSSPGVHARIVRVKELPDLPDIRLGSNGTPSTIDLGPLPPRNQVTLELDVSPDAPVGPVTFRLQTPLGTSPEGEFLVEPFYGEAPDREPNDTPDAGFETYLPAILVGTISKPGDVDFYRIEAKAGEEIVLEDGGRMLGSALRPVIGIYAAGQQLLGEFGTDGSREVAWKYRFDQAGVFYLRISDYQQGGSARHFYRIKTGALPVVLSAFPLGVAKDKASELEIQGYNLPAKLEVTGKPSPEDEHSVVLRPAGKRGASINDLRLTLSELPAVMAAGTNTSAAQAQPVTTPIAINGRLTAPEHSYRFRAKKGEPVLIEVNASRLGSKLDSVLEVLDTAGKPIERATVRCVLETSIVLRDHDSAGPGIRIQSPTGLAVGDYMMIGSEIIRIEAMPRGPDDDCRFEQFGGQRIAYFGTTPEAHAQDSPAYKVEIHPPGTQFSSNGLPIVRLTYRNDDGGPGYGKDSRLRFEAPADGEYIVRLSDVRNTSGPDLAYRLDIRPPQPDFRLTVAPKNPNVPQGGRIPLTVVATRMDGFSGPIDVKVEGLPPGIQATSGTIAAGQESTTLQLSADAAAKLDSAIPLKVLGTAGSLHHYSDSGDNTMVVALMPEPDLQMTSETKQVELEPGGTAEVTVSIHRNHSYGGRVPVEVRNLPPGVRVLDVGLNGVLINEDENRRSFTLEALPSAEPIEQTIYVSGKVETRAPASQQTSYAGDPIVLRVKPKQRITSAKPGEPANRPTAVR